MEAVEYQAMHAQEQHLWWYRALHNIILDRIGRMNLPSATRLLDAGCGTGGLLGKIYQTFPEFELIGLEFHPEGIRHIKECSVQGAADFSIINGDINHMPFAENCFDVLTLTDVLYHENIQPQQCLAECLRVLKPGGHLLVNVSAYNWMLSKHDKQVHTRERYTAGKLQQQLKTAGFNIHHVGYWNSLLFPLMAAHRMTAGQLKKSSDVESLPAWQDNLFYHVIHCEQFLQRHHIHLPFGGSVWAWANKA